MCFIYIHRDLQALSAILLSAMEDTLHADSWKSSIQLMLGLRFLLLLAGAFEHLLDGGEVDTLVLGKTDPGVLSLTNNEDVSDSGGEVGTSGISDVDNVESTEMSFTGSDDTDSSDVVTVSDCADVS